MGWFTCYGVGRKEEKSERESDRHHVVIAKNPVMAGKVQPDVSSDNAEATASTFERSRESSSSLQTTKSITVPKYEIPQGLNIHAHTFTFHELAVAAQNFSEDCLIGEGGFGPVFRGYLDDGQVVAIKKLNRHGLQGNREFLVEVLMLSLLQHDNLVNLIGYCADGDQRLLVYEYMTLGSLEDHLHDIPEDQEPLDWNTRIKIAAGAAKGLKYLHDTANPPVIYRDLKSSNILLGDDFHPKLSDFGLAKLGPVGDKSHVSTRVMGTYGYCAPEYAMTGQLTMKSDVYSFGVVLLELISGKKAMDQMRPSGQHNLVAWARPLFKDRKKFAQMADPNLQGNYPARGLFQALAVAAMCVHEQAASRPLIADVVTALTFLSQTPNNTPPATISSSARSSSAAIEQQISTSTADYSLESHDRYHENILYDKQSTASLQADSHDRDTDDSHDRDGDDADDKRQGAMESETKYTSWRSPARGKEREQAIAEARIWGETWREKRQTSRLEKEGE